MSAVTAPPMARRLVELARNGLGAPLVVMALLAMIVVPLPPMLLDALFSFNIAISLVVLLAVVYVQRPLDFTIFPIILLTTTMLRLALNVASTRVILLHGQDGHDAQEDEVRTAHGSTLRGRGPQGARGPGSAAAPRGARRGGSRRPRRPR